MFFSFSEEEKNWEYVDALPEVRNPYGVKTVKNSQFNQPLLEFSGACAGCGETPYAKLVTQLYGDHMYIATATGCSQVWATSFPSFPYCTNKKGHGPAVAGSLFENNAEFGMGIYLSAEQQRAALEAKVEEFIEKTANDSDADSVRAAAIAWQDAYNDSDASAVASEEFKAELAVYEAPEELAELTAYIRNNSEHLRKKSIWIFGGDGWAYDIGYGGLDHVISTGANVNIMVFDLARMTGIDGVYRIIHLHALNLKETAIRHAKTLGKKYEDCNFVVCHIGGGVSVSAHRGGRMVDGYDIVGGEGPMAPTRCGSISVANLLNYLKDKDLKEVKALCAKTGGFVSQVGISDAIELTNRAAAGDKKAEMVWNTMIYQIAKGIGSMASVLEGKVDGILLGGGMVHSKDLVQQLKQYCGWIAPITAYPGEFEMEAMAAGALRVLRGEEEAKHYTGKLVWDGFSWDK